MYAVANNAAIVEDFGQPERDTVMIFTRRFGALAARRVFPHVADTEQEQVLDPPLTDAEPNQAADQSAEQSAA